MSKINRIIRFAGDTFNYPMKGVPYKYIYDIRESCLFLEINTFSRLNQEGIFKVIAFSTSHIKGTSSWMEKLIILTINIEYNFATKSLDYVLETEDFLEDIHEAY